jgi:hypothetical protein
VLDKLQRLIGRESRLDKAAAIVASARGLANVQAMQSLTEWLDQEQRRTAERKDGLMLLKHVDADLRAVMDEALESMVAAQSNHARMSLLLQTVVPYCAAVLGLYATALPRELPILGQSSGNAGVIQGAVANWLYWLGRDHVVRFVREPKMDRLPWNEIRPSVDFALRQGGSIASRIAKPDGEAGRLQRHLAHLVLLSRTLTPDLQGRQLLIADKIAQMLSVFIVMSEQHSSSTPFGQIHDNDNPPTMMTQLPTAANPKGLYYGLDKSLLELAALENLLITQGKMPPKLDTSGTINVAETLAVIKYLKARWSGREVKRMATRKRLSGTLSVAHDFGALRRVIVQATSGAQTKTVEHTVERCEVEDVSATGVGLKLVKHNGWAKVGMVVAIRTDNDRNWRIGMLRRVVTRAQGEVQAGVQLLCRDPESVRVVARAKVSQWEAVSDVQSWENKLAIYLRPEPLNDNQHVLITAKHELQAGMSYGVPSTRDGDHVLRVISLMEVGADCALYRCELLPPEGQMVGGPDIE